MIGTAVETMEPDERTFRQHVARGRFQVGVGRGDWRVVREAWPNPIIAVTAVARSGAPSEVALRFTLTGYPAVGPTAAPWDPKQNCGLAHDLWPTGGRVGIAFNPGWNATAIYHPIDRIALEGHDGWRTQDPGRIWDPARMDVVDYLKVIHELLHSSEYSGIRRAA